MCSSEGSFTVSWGKGMNRESAFWVKGRWQEGGWQQVQASLQVVWQESEAVFSWWLCQGKDRPGLGRDGDTEENHLVSRNPG